MIRKKTLLLGGMLLSNALSYAQERPNIIVFLVDDMGVMDTSVPFLCDEQGNAVRYPLNEWYHTPNMERLAQQGIRFSTFYAQSVSSPSRASLMTGQNAARHRTTNWIKPEENNRDTYGPKGWNWEGIDKNAPTLPRLLREAGYKTIHVGKAHFGHIGSIAENPLNIGFDVNIAGSAIGSPGSYLGENAYGLQKGNPSRAVKGLDKYHGTSTFLTDALTLEACHQVSRAVAEHNPFFLYMAHYAVHAPFEADPRFMNQYADASKPKPARNFASLVESMDKSLGDLMNHLDSLGVADKTLILFLGDNGSDAPLGDEKGHFSSAPLRGMKGSEYEGGVRVPFIASWGKPDSLSIIQQQLPIPRGSIQQQMGTIMDIYPTLLRLGKSKIPAGYACDGYDLSTQLSGQENKSRPERFLMHFPHEHRGSYFTTYRNGPWKLIYFYNPQLPAHPAFELYNLEKDPFEIHNCATMETDRLIQMMEEMTARLAKEGALYPEDETGKILKPVVIQKSPL